MPHRALPGRSEESIPMRTGNGAASIHRGVKPMKTPARRTARGGLFRVAARAALVLALAVGGGTARSTAAELPENPATSAPTPAAAATPGPMLALGAGDSVSVQVYGRPELTLTTYVADDGAIPVPLAGRVPVSGLAPAEAAERIASAYRQAKFLVDPPVTVLLPQSRSPQASVLGAVQHPGRSGGVTARGSRKRIEVRRRGDDGSYITHPVELAEQVQAGDVIRVKERIF